MPASMLYHTFGNTMRNPRKRGPTMCLPLTLFFIICKYDPLAPDMERRTLLKSSLSMMITNTHAEAIANAGAALNMNLPADIAMKIAAASQTTMNMYSA